MDKKYMMLYVHNATLHSREKEVDTSLGDRVGGTGEHSAKWNMPGGEGEMPYYLNSTRT